MGSIFLSYTGVDRDVASRIVKGLENKGVVVRWGQGTDDTSWGDRWTDKLDERLSACSAYVFLIGADGIRRWAKAELAIAFRHHLENKLPILPVLLPGVPPASLPPFLVAFQVEHLSESGDRFDVAALAARLEGGLSADNSHASPAADPDCCPFPGLEAFGEDDALFFHGRQRETLDALRLLGLGLDGIHRRWLQIEGPSGIGKSSLAKAGLIPAIRRGWIDGERCTSTRVWHVTPPMRPGINPVESLAELLGKLDKISFAAKTFDCLYNHLKEGEATALRDLLRQSVPEGDGVLLFVDQLEAIFSIATKNEDRARFDALLAEALLDPDGPLYVVSTIRSDGLLRFAELPRLHSLLNQSGGRYLLPPISKAGLLDILQTPQELAGLRWRQASFPEEVATDAANEPGTLPQVCNLLRLIWEERDGDVLDASIYWQEGGLGGVLASRADLLLRSLGVNGKERAHELLLSLVEPGRRSPDSRRTITKAMAHQAMAHAAAVVGTSPDEVLTRLSGVRSPSMLRSGKAIPRLIRLSEPNRDQMGDGDTSVDLAHEVLLQDDRHGTPYWKTLRELVNDHRNELEDRPLLESLAETWDGSGGHWYGETLAKGRQLEGFARVSATASDLARTYLRASKRWRLFKAVSIPTAAAVLAFAWWIDVNDIEARAGLRALGVKIGLSGLAVPEMIALPAGVFHMGSPEGEGSHDEHPRREVAVTAFAMGKYEVTFSDWDTCYAAGGCSHWPDDRGRGRGRLPVTEVTRSHAQEYVAWLNAVTGDYYRLPSEAEWEYAARAGTTTDYAFGDDLTEAQAHFDQDEPTDVGAYPANAWGLHDMHGNAWEWVDDCYHDSYEGAPSDASTRQKDGTPDVAPFEQVSCNIGTLRGGSWHLGPEDLRSARRLRAFSYDPYISFGFRIAEGLQYSEGSPAASR